MINVFTATTFTTPPPSPPPHYHTAITITTIIPHHHHHHTTMPHHHYTTPSPPPYHHATPPPGIFKTAMTHPKLGLSKDHIAHKLIPHLFPLAIDNSLNLKQVGGGEEWVKGGRRWCLTKMTSYQCNNKYIHDIVLNMIYYYYYYFLFKILLLLLLLLLLSLLLSLLLPLQATHPQFNAFMHVIKEMVEKVTVIYYIILLYIIFCYNI